MFQENNATVHISRETIQWKQKNTDSLHELAPESPDINVNEAMWKNLKLIQTRVGDIKSREDLIENVLQI